MFADQLRRAIEGAPRITLPQVTALLWRAYGEGQVSDAEAEALQTLIEARRIAGAAPNSDGAGTLAVAARKAVGSRPRSDASMERRRRWAASGRLPPAIAARFTLAEQAALALVAAETARRGDCRLAIEHMAAVAGVSRSTVKNALREAARLGLVTIEERRITGFRNDTNIVRVVSAEWQAWLRLTRRPSPREGGGVKSATGTDTQVLDLWIRRPAEPSHGLPRGSGRPRRRERSGIVEGGAGAKPCGRRTSPSDKTDKLSACGSGSRVA